MLYTYNKKDLIWNKVSIKMYIYSILIIGVIFSSFGFTGAIQFNTFIERIPVLIHSKQDELNVENVKSYLKQLHIQHEEVVFKQIMLESNRLKSKIAVENSNIIGMKLAKTRPTTAIGEQYGHAYYKDWKSSLQDFAIWQSAYARNLTKEQYLQVIDKIYAEDDNYLTKSTKVASSDRARVRKRIKFKQTKTN